MTCGHERITSFDTEAMTAATAACPPPGSPLRPPPSATTRRTPVFYSPWRSAPRSHASVEPSAAAAVLEELSLEPKALKEEDPGKMSSYGPAQARRCPCCAAVGRRRLILEASAATAMALQLPATALPAMASGSGAFDLSGGPAAVMERMHPRRWEWYEDFYAQAMDKGMKDYEFEAARYKDKLFTHVAGQDKKVLELGVGTGPNFKYYAMAPNVNVIGVDPNRKMEKYARAAAESAGLPSRNFSFELGVGEALDIKDNTMDVVIGTLVLCSVKDVENTLREVKRVLKPGGLYLFMEHVAARDGSPLRLVQNILDPLQQFVADGCHLTRDTGKQISEAGFSSLNLNKAFLSSVSLISPHVYGIARK